MAWKRLLVATVALACVVALLLRLRNEPTATSPEGARSEVTPTPIPEAGNAAPATTLQGARPQAPTNLARLTGRVTDAATGAAVFGARVVALRVPRASYASSDLARAEVATAADGRFEFRDLRPGTWRAFALKDRRATRGLAESRRGGYDPLAVELEVGKTTTLDLVLVAAAVASGRVLDADGKPYAGATVTAVPLAWGETDAQHPELTALERATSAADGAWRIDTIPPGSEIRLVATAPDRLAARAGPFLASDALPVATDIVFQAVRFVDVRVVDEKGAPVPGALVLGWFPRQNGWKGMDDRWPTDAQGRLHAGPLPAGPVRLSAEPPKRRGRPSDARSEPIPPEQTEIVLVLPGGIEAGEAWTPHATTEAQMRWPARVTGPDGMPVPAGSAYTWTEEEGENARRGVRRAASSGYSGRPFADGLVDLRVREPDPKRWAEVFDARTHDGAPLPYAPVRTRLGEAPPLEIRMPAESALSGRVLGPDGSPVAGALVVAYPEWWRERSGPVVLTGHASARTDDSGAFRVGRLADIEYDLEVRPPPHLAAGGKTPARAGASDVVIRLASSVAGVVTVLDDLGAPVVGAKVMLLPVTSDPFARMRAEHEEKDVRTSDSAGAIRYDSVDPSKAFELRVDPPTDRPELKPGSLAEWRGGDGTVRLTRTWTISGFVRDSQGAPVAGAMIVQEKPPPQVPADARVTMGAISTSVGLSEADGSFSVVVDSAGPATLFAQMSGSSRGRDRTPPNVVTTVAGATDVTLLLDPGLSLEVVIEAGDSSKESLMLARAVLLAESASEGRRWRERVGPDGRLRFSGLLPGGAYTLYMHLPEADLVVHERGLRGGGEPHHARPTPGLSISGRLNVPVGATRPGIQASMQGVVVSGRVDSEGRYEIRGLPAGTFRVEARAGPDFQAEDTVDAGKTLDLVLAPP